MRKNQLGSRPCAECGLPFCPSRQEGDYEEKAPRDYKRPIFLCGHGRTVRRIFERGEG